MALSPSALSLPHVSYATVTGPNCPPRCNGSESKVYRCTWFDVLVRVVVTTSWSNCVTIATPFFSPFPCFKGRFSRTRFCPLLLDLKMKTKTPHPGRGEG